MTQAIEPAATSPAPRHLLIVCALLSAAARFVPVPLLDDVVRERVRQYLVSRLLRQSGRTFGSARVGPLWKDASGCASGCLALLWRIPVAIILFPIRKLIAIVTAVHGFAKDVADSLLFGGALARALERGLLAEGSPEPLLLSESTAVRDAYQAAVMGVDKALLTTALAGALGSVQGLRGAAVRAARSLVRSVSPVAPEAPADAADRQVVEQGADAVEQTLEQPEIARVLADFDARFDAALPQR